MVHRVFLYHNITQSFAFLHPVFILDVFFVFYPHFVQNPAFHFNFSHFFYHFFYHFLVFSRNSWISGNRFDVQHCFKLNFKLKILLFLRSVFVHRCHFYTWLSIIAHRIYLRRADSQPLWSESIPHWADHRRDRFKRSISFYSSTYDI